MTLPTIKVLLLDDDKQDYILVSRMLDKVPERRFHVDWVATYDEACKAVEKDEHDAYLIDVMLGTHSGVDLLEESLRNGFKKPMIMLTAHGDVQLDLKVIQMGAADYVPKRELSPTLLGRTIIHAIERNQLMEKLYYQATHDEVTGLYNRKFILEQLASLISSAKRHQFSLSFCLCDLDYFKQINDAHGHLTGDQVLHEFGLVLSRGVRAEDLPGRYGGDEFCIVFPHATPEQAMISVERIRQQVGELSFKAESGETFRATATFGIADMAEGRDTPRDLILAADKALFKAKEAGRNRCVAFNPNAAR
ncbi:MAG: diguanylate cyclase [Acidobacteriota bacterium]|nr:diguanylate cyclase [Acidobacteriota bacterium]